MMKYKLGANKNPEGRIIKDYHICTTKLPDKIITDISFLPRLDQSQQPACVGHAGANAINFDYYKKTGKIVSSSARWNYAKAKKIDGNLEEGTSAYSMFEAWKLYLGSATTTTVPNDVSLPVTDYANLFTTSLMSIDASKYPVLNETEVTNPSDVQIKSLINQYGVVLLALKVDENTWMNQDGHVSLKPGVAGGHEVLCFGYDTVGLNGDTRFFILNSWSANWGNNGTGTFMWSDYDGSIFDAMSVTINMNPIATLTRGVDDMIETLGKLSYGSFICDTLERSWKNNTVNISCIPKGTYNCIWTYMGDLKEFHYQIQNVPGRSGIFIHEGNYYTNSEGCVLIGSGLSDLNKDKEKDVLNSRVTLTQFENLLNKQPFILTIK